MTLHRIGGVAAFICAATYLVGFAFLVTVFAPLQGADDMVAFIHTRGGLFIAWNTTIYIINALALLVLVVALSRASGVRAPGWAAVTQAIGVSWATLVLGAGMVANVAAERAAQLYPTDPGQAAEVWSVLHAVELGLGGGNEIAGGAWIFAVSIAASLTGHLSRGVTVLGVVVGTSGFATVVPTLGEIPGAIFGLGAIAWFLGVAWQLGFPREGSAAGA